MPSETPHSGTDPVGQVVARRTFDGNESVSRAVVEALDTLPEFEATEGDALYDYVDPDALDTLFESRQGETARDGTVSFPIQDYRVFVEPASGVVVRDAS